jgi:hypothetical protein
LISCGVNWGGALTSWTSLGGIIHDQRIPSASVITMVEGDS